MVIIEVEIKHYRDEVIIANIVAAFIWRTFHFLEKTKRAEEYDFTILIVN